MQDTKFDVPSGYEDFVTGADELLKQFEEVGVPDRCTYSIFFYSQKSISEALDVRNKILTSCQSLSNQYLWHKQSLNLTVSVHERTGLVFLTGTSEYAENVEDEWFIVYLLTIISKQYKTTSITVSDSTDGQFLLIEAADFLDDWVSPENTENRVWIRNGSIYVIPLDEPGRLKNGGLSLTNALEFMSSTNTANVARAKLNTSAHRAIAARTSLVYPTRIKALEHRIVCIMPRWAAASFTAYPQLLSHAVSAFSSCDSFNQPTKNKKGSNPSVSTITRSNHEAAIITITLTRALFAQLTFKPNFKPPRHHHALLRRVSNAGSIKVRKAFDIGCRLVCGLEELCVSSAQVAIAANACAEETLQSVVREIDGILYALQGKTSESIDSLASLYHHRLLSLYYDESHELDSETQEYQHMMHVQSLFQVITNQADSVVTSQPQYEYIHTVINQIVSQLSTTADTNGVLSLITDPSADADSFDSNRMDREFFSVIANDTLKSDSDAWLYMSPEEMDAEMTNRMKMFASTDDNNNSSNNNSVDGGDENIDEVYEEVLNNATQANTDSTMEIDQSAAGTTNAEVSDTTSVNNMQDIVDGVKKFLKGKSDFEGISPKLPVSHSTAVKSTVLASSPATAEGTHNGLALDNNYLQQLLTQNALSKVQDDTKMDTSESAKDNEKTNRMSQSGITMEQIDFHYNEELHNLQKYFSREDLEQLSSDDDSGSEAEDDGDDYSGVGSSSSDSDVEDEEDRGGARRKSEGVFMNPTTVTGVAKATISGAAEMRGGESETEDDSDDEQSEENNRNSQFNNKRKVKYFEKEEEEEEDSEGEEEMTDADYQAMMDMELFGQAAMAETFERKPAPQGEEGEEGGLGEVDVDLNLLKNLLESHSQGLGLPVGPASQLLAQFGIQMPRPPPMRADNTEGRENSSGTESKSVRGKG